MTFGVSRVWHVYAHTHQNNRFILLLFYFVTGYTKMTDFVRLDGPVQVRFPDGKYIIGRAPSDVQEGEMLFLIDLENEMVRDKDKKIIKIVEKITKVKEIDSESQRAIDTIKYFDKTLEALPIYKTAIEFMIRSGETGLAGEPGYKYWLSLEK